MHRGSSSANPLKIEEQDAEEVVNLVPGKDLPVNDEFFALLTVYADITSTQPLLMYTKDVTRYTTGRMQC
jgi:hypothetical protein